MIMACKRRKIILIIVEGPSDATALEHSFNALFNPDDVVTKIMHEDITADVASTSSNIIATIGNIVRNYASTYGLSRTDFLRVIHITDTDGTYISDDHVFEDINHNNGPEYNEMGIVASPISKIKERNARKKSILNKLSSLTTVWRTIPYSIYYMSCNLDHVLYDVQNSDDKTKQNNAFRFARRYKKDFDGFVKYISSPTFAVTGNYTDTWEYIRQGLNSLHRHTNLNLCFQHVLGSSH